MTGKKYTNVKTISHTHTHTDLWTRAIHLLQIEPSRSAETPNSLRDLNDMLKKNISHFCSFSSEIQLHTSVWMFFQHIRMMITQKAGKKKLQWNKSLSPPKKGWVPPSHQRRQLNKNSTAELQTSKNRQLADRDFAVHLLLRRFGDGTESNLQLLHHSRGNNHILFPHAGEHYSPFLYSTMGRVRKMLWNTSKATSARATALVGDTIYLVLPVALRRHFAEGPLMKTHCGSSKPHLKYWICVTAFINMRLKINSLSTQSL